MSFVSRLVSANGKSCSQLRLKIATGNRGFSPLGKIQCSSKRPLVLPYWRSFQKWPKAHRGKCAKVVVQRELA